MWTKWIRPLVIAFIFVITGFIMGSIVATKIALSIIDANQVVMIKAIEKHSVSNDLELKNKKGTTIIGLANEPCISDTITTSTNKKERGFFARFFTKSNIDELEN